MRGEVSGKLVGQALQLCVNRIAVMRRRAAHHVAAHVAAGRERAELNLVDAADALLEMLFGDAVKLQPLPAGDPQRAVAQLVAQVQLAEQLLAVSLPPGTRDRTMNEICLRLFIPSRAVRSSRSSC